MSGIIDTVGSKSGIVGSDIYPAGHILQVVNFSTDTQSSMTTSTSDAVVNGMTKDITPKGANSDFLVTVRWAGESYDVWDKVFNIQMNGARVNVPDNDDETGLAMSTQTYEHDNNSSTPDILNFSTLVKNTSSVIGTDITFRLVTSGPSSATLSNRTVVAGNEIFSSELIITEIKG